MKTLQTTLAAVALLVTSTMHANNIQVQPMNMINNGTSAQVVFDLSWENSWRGDGADNWDAAWVFIKYRTNATGPWHHANLSNTGHVAAPGSQVELGLLTPGATYDAGTNPVVGVFISRDVDGAGNNSLYGVELNWNYADLGISYNNISEVQIFAIEMVYVNPGAFAAGLGAIDPNEFTLTTINTANATTAPAGTGSLGGQAGGYPTGQTTPNSDNWPNGFNAFYCMKYEVSQQAYVDFLNTLTYDQQVMRTATAPNSGPGSGALYITGDQPYRSSIQIKTSGVAVTTPAQYACNLNENTSYGETDDGKDIACNYLSWSDLTAYLDWSGLRPMTELEFEKACRGPLLAVPSEYPWGTNTITSDTYTMSNLGAPNASIATNYSTTVGNANGDQYPSYGPMRVGIFAANSDNSGRVTSGASYYGIMELGGNVSEQAVYIQDETGRAFSGSHGNGVLATNGNPDEATWPVTQIGFNWRGGTSWDYRDMIQVSRRASAVFTPDFRSYKAGGRGVRLMP